MSDYIRVSGKTVEDALTEASIVLGTVSDNIEFRVIEHESRGFLGIGAKKAVIEARRKHEEEIDILKDVFHSSSESAVGKNSQQKGSKKSPKKQEKAYRADASEKRMSELKEKPAKPEKKNASEKKGASEDTLKTDKKAFKSEKKAEKKSEKKQDKQQDKQEKKSEKKSEKKAEKAGEKGFSKKVDKMERKSDSEEKNIVRVPADPAVAKDRAERFLSELLSAMGIEAEIIAEFEDNTLSVELEGEDMGLLIGKRGQTLDSVQYLTSLVVNKGNASYVRVRVDTEDYRERRKATLENLAKNMAFKVKKTRRSAYLEPMNPYERRIIHSALQNDPYVTTHSEGEEPLRKVVITLKKRETMEWDDEQSVDEF